LVNENSPQSSIFGFSLFWSKLTKNEENLENQNLWVNFSEIWYADASQQKKNYKKLFFDFGIF